MERLKIALVTGGTGGHLYPALALHETAPEMGVEAQLFVGRLHIQTSLPEGTKTYDAPPLRFRRDLPPNLQRIIRSAGLLRQRFRAENIQAVLAFGSYASLPGLLAALQLRLPLFLLEQNVVPGRVVSWMRPFARRVYLSFAASLPRFGRKGRWTGNPIRPSLLREFQAHTPEEARKMLGLDPHRPTVLVMGGSLGARPLVRLALQSLRPGKRYQVFLLTGEANQSWAEAHPPPEGVVLQPYCQRMGLAYRAATVAVSRAGGGAIAELLAFTVPTLLIPWPGAARGHQEANAREMARLRAMDWMQEGNLRPEKFRAWVESHVLNPERLKQKVERMRPHRKPRAAWAVWTDVRETLEGIHADS